MALEKNHSTCMALLNMIDYISNELNNNNHSIGVFIDLSKAFDTIDHSLLLKKLKPYGMRGTALSWFTGYFTNRFQYVFIGGNNSSYLQIRCGVPQGSILGPLLFIVNINDIINCSKAAILIMFADDTHLFFKQKNLKTLYKHVNIELQKISSWFMQIKLSLNVRKTNCILFTSNRQKIDTRNLVIKIDDIIIEYLKKTKFLGVIITQN